MTIKISPLRDDEDVKSFCRFVWDLIDEDIHVVINKKPSVAEEHTWLYNRLIACRNSNAVFLVAKDNGKVVGIAESRRKAGHKDHIAMVVITIAKGYRRKGLGSQLLEKLLVETYKLGVELVYLFVSELNEPAIRFYEKIGFRRVAVLPDFLKYSGNNINEIVMVRWHDKI